MVFLVAITDIMADNLFTFLINHQSGMPQTLQPIPLLVDAVDSLLLNFHCVNCLSPSLKVLLHLVLAIVEFLMEPLKAQLDPLCC